MEGFILVVGGSSSGKSEYAEERAEEIRRGEGGGLVYLATGVVTDDEFADRVEQHRKRRPEEWLTVEEPYELHQALSRVSKEYHHLLLEGMGSWVSNIILATSSPNSNLSKSSVEETVREKLVLFLEACKQWKGTGLVVADEVGMGVVPPSSQGRIFRDLNGKVNRILAEIAQEVVQVTCGLPLTIKKDYSFPKEGEYGRETQL